MTRISPLKEYVTMHDFFSEFFDWEGMILDDIEDEITYEIEEQLFAEFMGWA